MHKVDAPGATPANEFTDGDPQSGVPATTLEAKFMNTVQRELVNVVEQENIELDDQDDTQIYQALSGMMNNVLEPGTKMLFSQAAAPQGWTQLNDLNDRVIRVVNGSSIGGETGGNWVISGLSAAAHMHNYSGTTTIESVQLGFISGGGQKNEVVPARLHKHRYSGQTQVATAPVISTGSWRPSYLNVIICQKR